ncbi:putative DNA-directed RNA polymerase III subunit [Clavispora lusitaniae]|uniref:DNA-directed RNA polymerase III subunit n=1 Tax=Clavispora lusitaniae TaxID=36911 RepID=A0ACD0WJ04_CLALS|nr:putative DNA-directed RNA polymerase III subunit [Clavispora lusitaniae]QFZ33371.1 putative DNA-directed RNA polymerase III subunit [Clavispora lusitaniae]QFZ39042.1 putative DNA-directed RNA polymerase III subunit [Clavispora lusitaniae]QFZ44724.1 putative DNA-directed RNA polymerase III subunit [Clavispora lusitaniae]QFZ50401.1 putative DNA-directed RNA polymerase III subunit [Clavispora lusitaniae]
MTSARRRPAVRPRDRASSRTKIFPIASIQLHFSMKEVVVDVAPKCIKGLEFSALSARDIVAQSEVEITTRDLYDLEKGRSVREGGALDTKMGTSTNAVECSTCHGNLATCHGHFGHVRLALPVFHVGYFKAIISVLQCICKNCAAVLLDEQTKRAFLSDLRRPNIDNLRRMKVLKKVVEQCKKQRRCLKCHHVNGVVKKAASGAGPAALKILHDTFRYVGKKSAPEKDLWDREFDEVFHRNPELEKFAKRVHEDLNPLKVLNLFRQITPQDCELFGIDAARGGRPEMYIWRYLPAPPVCIRPSVMMDNQSNEDDLTVKLTEIVWTSSLIKAGIEKGISINNMMEQWDYLQLSVAMYINSDSANPALLPGGMGGSGSKSSKPIRGFCQRLKGKQGRFRGNLSGKRVDFSGRTVISPDPNLRIDEVAVPDRVAKILTYPEKCTRYNRQKLQKLILNGPTVHPGANYVLKQNEVAKRNLKFGDRVKLAKTLRIGDIVERHIEDGDVVLFNRQPSLHRLSILSHYAKIRPWRTFRLNECVCTPYNADFDGDEMNLHVPQTEEARAEAINLMGVKNNLLTPKSGEPIIAATQDFITGSYLISHKDSFFDRASLVQLLCMMSDADMQFDIPPPTVFKPVMLWTGKQVFSMLIRPNKKSNVVINVDAKNKTFIPPPKHLPNEMSPNDGFVVIRGSQILSGVMDKSTLGDGKKHSVFYTILRDYGPDEAAKAMNRMAKLCARYLGNRGFSIGINDVTPGADLKAKKERMVEAAYAKCDELIDLYTKGKLETQPGCNEEQTLEAKIGGLLSKVREEVGEVCIRELDSLNAPLIMATCGSKGSTLNVSQMVAVVGQQIISGNRVPDGFQDRSLPHFTKMSKTPQSKGFVRNSFFSGLSPPEFLFHAISGREGLVDTAVKTAETGYMSRRLMKSLEDLSSSYDNTVRNSSNGIVQFTYGGDGLDPLDMEGDAQPVNFNRQWDHAYNITYNQKEANLLPFQIMDVVNSILAPLENKLVRYDNLGNLIEGEIGDRIEYIDQKDAERAFYQSIRTYVQKKATQLARLRQQKKLRPFLTKLEDDGDMVLDEDPVSINAINQLMKISRTCVEEFLKQCLYKYLRARVEPGTAVGAIGAHSIGEPGTQMTLKTFHFAGVASMNVTLGVPRIKEIINAAKVISTPIINTVLVNDEDEVAARVVKGRIEKTLLRDVAFFVEDVYKNDMAYLSIKIDLKTIEKLQLELTMDNIRQAIANAPKLKILNSEVSVYGKDRINVLVTLRESKSESLARTAASDYKASDVNNSLFFRMQHLKRALPDVVIKGLPNISRAVINIRDDSKKELLVEGYGLKDVMSTDGIVGTKTSTNHVLEVYEVLGIEAARASIIGEIDYTMSKHGMSVDPRHIQLLGDVMTYKGEVLGITRFGLSKMRDSVLQLASFEKTTDHLFDAAFFMKNDKIEGVSECIILGQTMSIGTGAFKLVKTSHFEEKHLKPKPCLFEGLCEVSAMA